MAWKKLGLIIRPNRDLEWSQTHASVPIAQHLNGDRFRIYYGTRNSGNLTQLAWSEIDLQSPSQILEQSKEPALKLGDTGTFDDSAVFPSWLIEHGNKWWMYYVGWMQGKTVPFYASLGLAISSDGGKTFERHSRGPLLERSRVDPFFTASACVLRDSNRWQMWYSSGTQWKKDSSECIPFYHLKYAESADGIEWKREGRIALDYANLSEHAFSRPCVVRENGIYKMWYSFRGQTYRIGYAESKDGIHWDRQDDLAKIDISERHFETEMIEYPFLFAHRGEKYLLYNGNAFGSDGVAMAIWEEN